MASDEELMAAIARGSEGAFGELLRRYERALAGFLRKQVGDADAEDVFQEVWLRVARGVLGFDRARRFKPWLYSIALNEARTWRARRGRVDARGLDALDPADPHGPPSGAGLDVERLLSTLPAEQREVLELRYQLDLSEAEIADVLGIPPGTVKSRAHTAMQRLSEFVKRKEG